MEALQSLLLTPAAIVTTVAVITLVSTLSVIIILKRSRSRLATATPKRIEPVSVNYHFTRVCNYSCGFCFHTSKDDHKIPLAEAKRGLAMLRDEGMKKINFAGGEPFLYPGYLGKLVQFCKKDLSIAVSIVSNGSLIKRRWFEKYGEYLDILAISVDSFDESVNVEIGRGKGRHLAQVEAVRDLCTEFNVRFKINSVVNSLNWEEDMTEHISQLAPFRWKVFQVLVIEGENSGDSAIRDASRFEVTNEQFASFVDRHKSLGKVLVPESNDSMRSSYLLLDERLRFLDCSQGSKQPSDSILDVGVQAALQQSGFDAQMFGQRGGYYDWATPTKATDTAAAGQCSSPPKHLDW
eukprot:TRINITY_DN2242_c0_g1_i1.p1 TRINITY_DN2242_c0_g1~~TRINITY_DN2242_c0_g1_i1.p1  ORF type:complete len:382 (-),score=88.77 TRINITY_DN2242_c0_g1_i1:30-1082(-)